MPLQQRPPSPEILSRRAAQRTMMSRARRLAYIAAALATLAIFAYALYTIQPAPETQKTAPADADAETTLVPL